MLVLLAIVIAHNGQMLEFAMYHTPMIVAANAQHQDIAHIANELNNY